MENMAFIGILILAIFLYIFICYCYQRICEKAGQEAGVLIWIPLLQFIPLCKAADVTPLIILAFFIPFLNLVALVYLWAKICIAIDKSPLLVILMFVPILNLFFIPYLAFSN